MRVMHVLIIFLKIIFIFNKLPSNQLEYNKKNQDDNMKKLLDAS